MQSFILFNVGDLRYAMGLDNIQRILAVPKLTPTAQKDKVFEGMMPYEDDVIDVVSFRKMISMQGYADKVAEMFVELKGQHKAWVDALNDSVHKHIPFTKTTDPHACHLGKWIDNFSSYDEEVIEILRHLNTHHQALHKSAVGVLERYDKSPETAIAWCDTHVKGIYDTTIGYLNSIAEHSEAVANDSQKLLILDQEGERFGLKVDTITDIIHVEESAIKDSESLQRCGKYICTKGVLEHDDKLCSIIDSIAIHKEKVEV